MKKRASEAGVIIEREHDPKRTYLSNDSLAQDTINNTQKAYYLWRARMDKDAANLILISANRGYDIAQVAAGKVCLHGKGVKPDVIEAYKWFVLANNETGLRNAAILKENMSKEEIERAEYLVDNFIGSYK